VGANLLLPASKMCTKVVLRLSWRATPTI